MARVEIAPNGIDILDFETRSPSALSTLATIMRPLTTTLSAWPGVRGGGQNVTPDRPSGGSTRMLS
jgi:hypothetical protein